MNGVPYGWQLGDAVQLEDGWWRMAAFNHRHRRGVRAWARSPLAVRAAVLREVEQLLWHNHVVLLDLHPEDDLEPSHNIKVM